VEADSCSYHFPKKIWLKYRQYRLNLVACVRDGLTCDDESTQVRVHSANNMNVHMYEDFYC